MSISNKSFTIRAAAEAVIRARDFCGDERRAAIEALAEQGLKPTTTLLAEIFAAADAEWAVMHCEAGVAAPISIEERAGVHQALAGTPD